MIYYVYFVCMVILSAFVPLYHVQIVPTEAKRRCQPPPPGSRVTDGCEASSGCLEPNLGSLQEN